MSGKPVKHLQHGARLLAAAILAIAAILSVATLPAAAASGDRTLYLHYTHTGETGSFTFRRNGRYDKKVLQQLNVFLADWRTKEPTRMDPALFDLIWSVYQEVGGRQPIHIVSSYRSPKTNEMLRKRSSGVAENSQHTKGKAIDFFIPGVNLTRLREVAMRHQVGGVGYYPTSGSPFVHLDTGNVRAWPRMTRAQLQKLFPDGRTLHLPTDGKPLSAEGRRYAQAQWQECHAVPCDRRASGTRLASLEEPPVPASKPRTLMDMFFGQDDDDAAPAEIRTAALSAPTQRSVATISVTAPVPALRSARPEIAPGLSGAPVPAQKSARLALATRPAVPAIGPDARTALAAIDDTVPQPRVLMSAYLPDMPPGPEARPTLMQDGTGVASAPPPALDPAAIQTASFGGTVSTVGLRGMLDGTFSAVSGTLSPPPSMSAALSELVESRRSDDSIEQRAVALVAPELDHVNETMVHPVLMASGHFAVMTEAEGYLDKQTELGPLSGQLAFAQHEPQDLASDHFVVQPPMMVAAL